MSRVSYRPSMGLTKYVLWHPRISDKQENKLVLERPWTWYWNICLCSQAPGRKIWFSVSTFWILLTNNKIIDTLISISKSFWLHTKWCIDHPQYGQLYAAGATAVPKNSEMRVVSTSKFFIRPQIILNWLLSQSLLIIKRISHICLVRKTILNFRLGRTFSTYTTVELKMWTFTLVSWKKSRPTIHHWDQPTSASMLTSSSHSKRDVVNIHSFW